MSYPKWVPRAPHVGPVLCQDEVEEKQLLDDWATEQKAAAKAAKAEADAAAKAAKAGADLT